MEIIWTKHALERQDAWRIRKGVTVDDVERVIRTPDQVVSGDQDALVAQAEWGGGLLRVPFVEVEGGRKILTLYWTSQIDRYWEKGDAP